jgi:uncharacterized membrane protein YkvI
MHWSQWLIMILLGIILTLLISFFLFGTAFAQSAAGGSEAEQQAGMRSRVARGLMHCIDQPIQLTDSERTLLVNYIGNPVQQPEGAVIKFVCR